MLKRMVLLWKVCDTRNNYVDCNMLNIKQQIIKLLNKDIVCIFEITLFIYHYTAHYTVL